jgi:hypothetical protein
MKNGIDNATRERRVIGDGFGLDRRTVEEFLLY